MDINQKFHFIKAAPKFNEDQSYLGLENPDFQEELSKLINDQIDRFNDAADAMYTEELYRDLIKSSLQKFDNYNLDYHDRRYISHQYQIILKVIRLESADDILNNWLYFNE